MKKVIYSFVLLISLAILFTSCHSSVKYKVLEAGGCDNASGANHQEEIDLENQVFKKPLLNSHKDIRINDKDYTGKYRNSQKGYLFKNDVDYYESNENGELVQFGINQETGRIDKFSWVKLDYINNKEGSALNYEQCLVVATKYLNDFVDATEYTLVASRYLEIPEYEAIYDFEFVRVIDGVKSSDKAYVGVTIFGDVISHLFVSLGEMRDATVPSADDFKIIENNVDKKVQSIYSDVYDKYKYSYEIADKIIVKLSDGKYAMEYHLEVTLTSISSPESSIAERTCLIVLLE